MKKNYIQPKMVAVNVYQDAIMINPQSIQGNATSNDFVISAPRIDDNDLL